MPEKGLDGPDIRAVFEEMCGEGMPERVHGHPLRDARPLFRSPIMRPMLLAVMGLPGYPREEPRSGPIRLQILDERGEGLCRENRVPILLPLTLPDEHRHAGTIDVPHLEMGHLADAKTRAVSHREYGPVFEVFGGKESPHFPLLEDHGHLQRPLRPGYLLHLLRAARGLSCKCYELAHNIYNAQRIVMRSPLVASPANTLLCRLFAPHKRVSLQGGNEFVGRLKTSGSQFRGDDGL